MEKKRSISLPKVGLDRETHPEQLENTQYTFCLNCNTEDIHGETLNIKNEPSNYLSVQFPPGYKNIGYRKHPVKDIYYFLLTNPTTGFSSFGYVEANINNIQYPEGSETVCNDCDYYGELPTPLEDVNQTPYNTYVELLNDSCNGDFNFSIDFPIHHIEFKIDNIGTFMYWADARNPDRYMNIDDIDFYKYTGEIVCGVDNRVPTCVNVEKMRQQPIFSVPIITPEVLQIGGNLRMGTYEFLIAPSDVQGNELSDYTSITQPIPIFDQNNRVLEQPNLDDFTNYAIRLSVSNLDDAYSYYKVVVVERVSLNQAESYFVEGVHPYSDTSIFYTSTQTGTENLGGVTQRINYDRLMSRRLRIEHTRGLVSSDNRLFKYGIKGKEFPNLQPIVNIIGGFVKWTSSVAKEGLYKDAIACSKYKGYMREEVQPFGIRFFNNDGSEYPVFPLVPRPAKPSETETVDDLNTQSVLANSTNCSTTDRTQRWQFFNTAIVQGVCEDFSGSGQEVEQQETASCIVEDVDNYENGTIIINDAFSNLRDYINENRQEISNPSSERYIPEIAPYLTGEYLEAVCSPNFSDTCDTPELISYYVQVQEVVNQQTEIVYNEDTATYPKSVPPTFCQPFLRNTTTGEPVEDLTFETDYALTTVYKRSGNFNNEVCVNALSVLNNNDPSTSVNSYYHNYYGDLTAVALQDTSKTISATDSNFYSGLHKGALWFKVDKLNRDQIILEITRNSECTETDEIPSVNSLRYSVFSSCSATTDLESGIVSASTGEFTILDTSSYPNTFYVAIDVPIVATTNTKFRTAPPCGCFSVYTRDVEIEQTFITFDDMIFQKINTYQATCTYILPEVNECFPIPYQYGEFSHWESTDNYPDNLELYDSSKLIIGEDDLQTFSEQQLLEFNTYYASDVTMEGNYILKESTNLACSPIRHYKFPSNIVSPLMGTLPLLPFSESLIFPLGIQIDSNIINVFLNIAVKNKLLTQKQRNEIVGYEILKGDNSIHKSIVSNSIGFDMYSYQEDEKSVLYPNYPFNDLGDDFIQRENGAVIPHPDNGQSNYNFSVLSPELSLSKPTIPTEIIISGFQFGNSRGQFNEVDEHSKWTLMNSNAKDTAGVLGAAEAILEQVIEIANVAVQMDIWVIGGTSSGTNAGGAAAKAAAIAALVAGLGVGLPLKIGQYRLQWLQTIRNLGPLRNYSSYYAGEGFHNVFVTNTQSDSILRGISSSRYIKDGRYQFKDEHNGNPIKINSTGREPYVFISTGEDYPVNYISSYTNYDNNKLSTSTGSRTVVSQNGGKQGKEFVRNSAVPYITLKNYIPNQFGTIDSIKWLTASYRANLVDSTDCEVIYGGNIYITRDVQERKHPIFRTDAFKTTDLLPFTYSNKANIGSPHYFVDYETGGQQSGGNLGSLIFPDIDSDYRLDNKSDTGFYVSESSKFYLYYYGFASYLIESEINTNFRYGRTQIKDQYYPDIQSDMVFFTQQVNRRISEPPTYYYNNVYSRPVTQTPYYIFPVSYTKEIYNKLNDAENGIIYSLQDNSQNDLSDPWLNFLPLNRGDIETKHGRLISLEDLGSQVLLARTENKELLLNSVDKISNSSNITVELGTGGVFSGRPVEIPAGTQNTEYLKTKYGNFSVDAKRGQVWQRIGQENKPISDITNQKQSGLKRWFRNQLPFKILKYFPNTNTDNKYKGIGLSFGVDNKSDRVFFTKRDYVPLDTENMLECGGIIYDTTTNEQVISQYTNDGYTYNGIINCKLNFSREVTSISNATDMHFIFDSSGSFDGAGLQQVRDAAQAFYDNYVATHPDYTGQRYNYNNIDERWVNFIQLVSNTYGGNIADKDVLIVSFTNESNSIYHSNNFTTALTPIQVNNYTNDYNNYNLLFNQFNSVFAVAYPIITTGASGSGSELVANQGKALIVQTLYAMYGAPITDAEFDTIPQNSVFTNPEWEQVRDLLVNGANPYNLTGLYDLGWRAQYDVNDVSGTVITDQRLNTDLTALISGGSQTVIEVVEVEMPESNFSDETKFKDVSFTIGYSPTSGTWKSYYSWTPDYYINYDEFFELGFNYGQDKEQIWSHTLDPRSHQVFMGRLYPFIIEYPIPYNGLNKYLNSVALNIESKYYTNEYDYSENSEIGFNKAVIYNQNNNSGVLGLNLKKSIKDVKDYPNMDGNIQNILFTSINNQHQFNYIYNRVKEQLNNLPIWIWDDNMIMKELNPQAVSFKGKKVLERLRGKYFLARLIQDKTSQYGVTLKNSVNEENDY